MHVIYVLIMLTLHSNDQQLGFSNLNLHARSISPRHPTSTLASFGSVEMGPFPRHEAVTTSGCHFVILCVLQQVAVFFVLNGCKGMYISDYISKYPHHMK